MNKPNNEFPRSGIGTREFDQADTLALYYLSGLGAALIRNGMKVHSPGIYLDGRRFMITPFDAYNKNAWGRADMNSLGLKNDRAAETEDYELFLDAIIEKSKGLTIITKDEDITRELLKADNLKVMEKACLGWIPHLQAEYRGKPVQILTGNYI